MLTALALVPGAFAHEGEKPLLVVPVDHITPGRAFPLNASDFEEGGTVSIALRVGKRAISLRRVTAGADGHFTTTLVVPRTVPDGYSELVATDQHGSKASVFVLVGDRPEAQAAPPPVAVTEDSSERSPVVTALILALLAAVLVAGGLLVGRRLRGPR